MNISFEIPREIESQLGNDQSNLSHEAKEVYLVELYRRQTISHRQLGESLGLDPYETDGLLKRYQVGLGISEEQMRDDAFALRTARPR